MATKFSEIKLTTNNLIAFESFLNAIGTVFGSLEWLKGDRYVAQSIMAAVMGGPEFEAKGAAEAVEAAWKNSLMVDGEVNNWPCAIEVKKFCGELGCHYEFKFIPYQSTDRPTTIRRGVHMGFIYHVECNLDMEKRPSAVLAENVLSMLAPQSEQDVIERRVSDRFVVCESDNGIYGQTVDLEKDAFCFEYKGLWFSVCHEMWTCASDGDDKPQFPAVNTMELRLHRPTLFRKYVRQGLAYKRERDAYMAYYAS